MSALAACGHLALAAVTPASGQDAGASGDVILSKAPIEARPIRSGFRGEDIVDAGPGYLVAGWAPGTPETPYVALLDGDLESVVWERMPHAEAGAMFTAVTRDPETGRAFVAGSAPRADVDGSDPLVVAIDTEGHELTRWHPVTDGNHRIWDVTHHAPTGAIFVAGETDYHRDGSHVFAAKLTYDLEPVWKRVFEFSLGRSGAYAMASIDEGLVMAGAASTGRGEDAVGYPALLLVAEDGDALARRVDVSKPKALYHWVEAAHDRIYAGGYTHTDDGAGTDALFDVLDPDFRELDSWSFGGDADDRTISSAVCDGRILFGGISRSYSETGWRGLIVEADTSAGPRSMTSVEEGSGTVAVTDLGCDRETGRPVYVGLVSDEDRLELVAGFLRPAEEAEEVR